MKFLADANIPQSVITLLTREHYDVLDIKVQNSGAKDIEIIELAQKEERIILTLDKDFLALTQFPKYQAPTIVIRLKNQLPQHISEHLSQLLKNQKEKIISSSLTVITEEAATSHPY